MPTFSANISMLFQEYPFQARFEKARSAGFDFVECMFPYQETKASLEKRLDENQLSMAMFNAPPGIWEMGERGLAAIEQYRNRFKESIFEALEYANQLKCKKIHVMAGSIEQSNDLCFSDQVFIENIRYAADQFAPYGICVLIEPLNRRDNPNYYLSDFHRAVGLIDKIQRNNVKLQFDFYHAQIIHGDVSTLFERYFSYVGHIQIAGIPERGEPSFGELNYNYVFKLIDQKDYQGEVGCEYRPATTTEAGLGWLTNQQKIS
ncbi:2-oxo-tetronate isomerase [Salinivibrio kushneri]|uniref:TIM barrel protein n=1 Tax=Salinivibrio kushneri TaxID=1908198 RepID=A0AA47KP99_9GAMM|nr:2-oxo-tetronate isomerase [Salinivibrio kushneri]WBA10509.1 TIM barrel protein [Salinivibrio kushneri]